MLKYAHLLAFLLTATHAATVPRPRQAQNQPASIQVPAISPQDASAEVDVDFAGLAFEQASWPRFAQDDLGLVNVFSKNLIDEIYSRTGGKPIIRLGGTTPDYGRYLPGQKQPALPVAEQDEYQNIGGTTIGPSFWTTAKNFPEAKFMVQVPLATTNVSETIAWATSAVEGIGMEQIHSIQVGNEPDLYSDNFKGSKGQDLSPPQYQGTLDNKSYVGNYTKYANAIKKAIKIPDRFFTAFDIAAHVGDHSVAEWLMTPEACFNLGIDKGGIIKEVSHHYYQNHAGGPEDLEKGLMQVATTHGNLDYLRPRINWLRENRPDVDFIINEVGNSLGPTNAYAYQARMGSALWAVDFYLYSLTIGVRRLNWQQIVHSGFNMWLPVASAGVQPQVFSNYYAYPFLTDFVGKSGKTRVAQAAIKGGDKLPNLVAYTAFDDGEAARMAVVNLQYWNRTSTQAERPVRTVVLEVPKDVVGVEVRRLSTPDGAGADASTMTYGGSQWTYKSLGKEVKFVRNDTTFVKVKDGAAEIKVPDSEAVIAHLVH